jgi:hypothetical protein
MLSLMIPPLFVAFLIAGLVYVLGNTAPISR